MHSSIVVLPTYNERDNIGTIVPMIFAMQDKLFGKAELSILVVDDNSPDGTADVVLALQRTFPNLYLISGKKEGLGKAYIRGMKYAVDVLHADSVFEMDADLSHHPKYIPRMLMELLDDNADFVIGSRYIAGGSLPDNWSLMRKLNSLVANLLARLVIGLYKIKDCTGGFRVIKSSVIRSIILDKIPVTGYAFQVSLLQRATLVGAKIVEIPIAFADRELGQSKMRFYDQFESVVKYFQLGLHSFTVKYGVTSLIALFVFGLGLSIFAFGNVVVTLVTIVSIALLIQGIWNLWLMVRVWDNPHMPNLAETPKVYSAPELSFTALLPVLHEEAVVAHTIHSLYAFNYPNRLKQILVVCRYDDTATIEAAQKAISELPNDANAEVLIYNHIPSNKPKQMNFGLQFATGDVIVPFDAEDGPHPDLYNIVNTLMVSQKADVVQSGVQLMNFESNWYSIYNVLEYFFWFKSVLPYFASKGAVPLGGNTVFFKREWLDLVGGWDEECLTEDAEIGMKLSQAGANIRVVYEEQYATQEETPPTVSVFIKQRTRWHQGFMQVIGKGQWRKFLTLRQQLLSLYVLIWPELQAILFLYAIVSAVTLFYIKLPVWATIISILPLYLLVVLFVVCVAALYQFCKSYDKRFPWWISLKMLVAFYPFQILLGVSAIRAVYRLLKGYKVWEKTAHIGAHRQAVLPVTVK